MMNSLYPALLIGLLSAAYTGAEVGVLTTDEILSSAKHEGDSPLSVDEFDGLSLRLRELYENRLSLPDDKGLWSEEAREQAELSRKEEEKKRLANELENEVKILNSLRERLAESPDDQELKKAIETVKAAYHSKIQRYNSVVIPRSKRLLEGDLPPEDMPWDRADGGKVSVTFKQRGREMTASDEDAEAVRVYLDDHASEWLRGSMGSTEGKINQPVFAGTVTIRKENGYSRTYVIVFGEGLRWDGYYLPQHKVFEDRLFNEIQSRYIKDVSKYPIDPEARKLMRWPMHK